MLLLISIPLTLFFIKRQQDLQSRAAPSSKLSFIPENPTTSAQCSSFTIDVMVDPGSNIISIVDFYLKYDPTKLDVLAIKEGSAFPTVVRPVSITSGEANMSVSIGADVTRAVQTPSKVTTITFKPKSAGSAQVQVDSQRSRVFSLAPSDEPTENVLFSVSPSNVTIGSGACLTGGTPIPTIIVPTSQPTVAVSPTPASAANQSPICTELSVSPSSSGSAPFSVLFTAKGNDPDSTGLIAKTTFNFGDGQVQDVTEGMNLKNVTAQINHTYQSGGTFGATATFTDNKGAISQSCSKTMTVAGSASATTTPTAIPTSVVAKTSPTAAPTIPPTGNVAKSIGIMSFVVLTIIGGFLLLAL